MLQRFIKCARDNSITSFFIHDESEKALFFKQSFGKGEYIFKISVYSNDPKFYFDPSLQPKLACIKVEDNLYIVDQYDFQYACQGKLPQGVHNFRSFVKKLNQRVDDELLPQYLAALDVSSCIEDEVIIDDAKKTAIKALLSKRGTLPPIKASDNQFITQCEAAQVLCGVTQFNNLVLGKLRSNEAQWIKREARQRKMQEFMNQDGFVSDVQLKIAAALRSIDAKFVTVEFSFKGNTATGKMSPINIYKNLEEWDYFGKYDFSTTKEGQRIFDTLDARDLFSKIEDRLTWRNISKITYKGKILYQA